MADRTQLSRPAAVFFGLLFIGCGLMPLLMGLGIMTPAPTHGDPTPAWVGTATGLLFVLAGATIILDYGIAGGVDPDGDLRPGTSFFVRVMNFCLGLSLVGLMMAVFAWVAFGRGPRTFSTTVALPFVARHNPHAGELSGRVAFGVVTIMMALAFVISAVVGVRRLVRAWRAPEA
jgi:hypothetical protein